MLSRTLARLVRTPRIATGFATEKKTEPRGEEKGKGREREKE